MTIDVKWKVARVKDSYKDYFDGFIGKLKACRIYPEPDLFDESFSLINAKKIKVFTGSLEDCKDKFIELIGETRRLTLTKNKQKFSNHWKTKSYEKITIDCSIGKFKVATIVDNSDIHNYLLKNAIGFNVKYGTYEDCRSECIKLLKNVDEDLIYKGLLCPYCFEPTEYIDSIHVYRYTSYGMVYCCKSCNAWVGVHKGTDKALGRLADKKLRDKKIETHDHFDKLWKDGQINKIWKKHIPDTPNRKKAYVWLSNQLGIDHSKCHIGMFDIYQCDKVIDICKNV